MSLQNMLRWTLIMALCWPVAISTAQSQPHQPKLHTSSISQIHRAPGSLAKAAAGQAVIRDLHVLAIRVEFQEDDNDFTSGNGKFLLADTALTIDPPPHNRTYFQDHMDALARYYQSVSGGLLTITSDVYPEASTDAYQLPQPMEYYNADGTDEELDLSLAQLLSDAVTAADMDPAINFAAYDAVVVFHAGVGLDYVISEGYEPTPKDIPSVFLNVNDLRNALGGGSAGYQGISVDDGAGVVAEAIILPEMSSKQEVEIALNGMVAHQFGHVLGLPSLFNTENGRPAIGMFGLMGVGFANENGAVPAAPSAWSKLYLGWDTAIEVAAGDNMPVYASLAADPRKIYKVPISATEYFLLENRQVDYADDSLRVTVSDNGVYLEADDYDGGLPGSGMLIWHIDERVINANISANRVNADIKRRGVDVEEADGSEDIGKLFEGALPGFALPDVGIGADMYSGTKLDENTPKLDHFTPETVPGTLSNDRAITNISITDISPIDTVMTFDLNIGRAIDGWPRYTGVPVGGKSPQIADINNDGVQDVVAAAGSELLIWPGGVEEARWGDPVTVQLHGEEARTYYFAGRFPESMEGEITSPPSFSTVGNSTAFTLTGSQGHFLSFDMQDIAVEILGSMGFLSYISSNVLVAGNAEPVYIMGDFQGDVVAIQNNDQAWRLSVGSQPVTHLTRIGNAEDIDVVAVTVNGEISRIQNGTELWSRQPVTAQPLGLAVADINRDGQEEIILALVDLTEFDKLAKTTTSPTPPSFTKLLVLDQQGNFIGNDGGEHEIENLSSSPTVGDINGDGYLNIVVRSSTHLYVFNYNGSLAEEFPVEVEGNDGIGWDLLPQPIIADLDNDGKLDILTGTRNGLLKAYNRYGEMLDGFPIAVGGPVQATPALGDIDANGTLDLVVAAEDRFVYAWDLEVPADVDIAWGTYGHDLQHTFRNADTAPAPQPTGPGLLVKKSVYNYPNPARGGQTMIHYVVNESCTIRVRIYNLAGELVAELGDGAAPIVDNEVIWQLDNVSSGVYMARVEADNGTTKEHAFCTIAVIK